MYSHLLPTVAAERVSDMRREASAASRARRARPLRWARLAPETPPARPAGRVGAGTPCPDTRLIPRTARP